MRVDKKPNHYLKRGGPQKGPVVSALTPMVTESGVVPCLNMKLSPHERKREL